MSQVKADTQPGRTIVCSTAGEDAQALALLGRIAVLLFSNGETTQHTTRDIERLADALKLPVVAILRWGEIALQTGSASTAATILFPIAPLGIHMGKVAAVHKLVDEICARTIDVPRAEATLVAIDQMPPASTPVFALVAGAGAAALGTIFGAAHPLSLVIIFISATLGGLLRRGLARISRNPFVQPFAAALLAGAIGALTVRLQLSSLQRLVAVCPCMVLVPGPHLLNGAIDLARSRIPLGAARLTYAGLIVAAICLGLLGGLALGGTGLPVTAPSLFAPLAVDVLAAGIAVAAYGTFFSMSWRTLPAPVAIGMLSHALRWTLITFIGASPETGALIACLLAGALATPVANWLCLPFAGLAFASVVSLIPGVYLFRMAGGIVSLISLGATAKPAFALATVADGASALLILLAMTVGLVTPKLLIEQLTRRWAPRSSRAV